MVCMVCMLSRLASSCRANVPPSSCVWSTENSKSCDCTKNCFEGNTVVESTGGTGTLGFKSATNQERDASHYLQARPHMHLFLMGNITVLYTTDHFHDGITKSRLLRAKRHCSQNKYARVY